MIKPVKGSSDYGVDAPPAIRNLTVFSLTSIFAGIVLYLTLRSDSSWIATFLLGCGLLVGGCLLVTTALLVWSSKTGKLKYREQLIDSLALHGAETVLDVGCGRGLLLVAAARQLTTGKAIGVDLWQNADLSGNHPEAMLANALAEGVAERVRLETADMRALPFENQTIDIVVSSLAIHNIPDKEGRAQAVREIARVLKPDGQLALLDIRCTGEYVQVLRALGWPDPQRSGMVFQIFPPVRVVTGKKPA